MVDVALANAHLNGIPANGSPGPQLLADLFNKPIEEMRAAKEAEVELPECLKREATAEETARIAQHAKDASPERESRCPHRVPGFFHAPLGDNLNRLTRCTLSRKKITARLDLRYCGKDRIVR